MNTHSGELPPVESVAAELGKAVAVDFLRKLVLEEHVSHSGNDFGRYGVLVEQQRVNSTTRYEGYEVVPCAEEMDREDEEWLQIPPGRKLWLALSREVEVFEGDGPGRHAQSRHKDSGYFWQNDNDVWETDVRNLCDPPKIGALTVERDARVRLINVVRAVGPAAVVDYVRVLPEMAVSVVNQKGSLHTTSFSADYLTDLLNRHRRNDPDPVRHTLPEVIDRLLRDESVARLRNGRKQF